jgi:hypothetical protein
MRKASLVLLLLAGSAARATVPSRFAVQGVLRNSTGQLQSMMVNVTTSLFDAQTSGNRLAGPFGPTAVMAQNGLFTLTIQDPNLQTELAPASQVWLEVTVGGDIFPRQLVTPQFFALLCGTADVAMSLPGVTVAGGNVGIGATTPASRLEIGGGGALQLDRPDGTQQFRMGYTANDTALRWSANAGSTLMALDASGNLGLGTATPAAKLHLLADAQVSAAMETFNSSATVGPSIFLDKGRGTFAAPLVVAGGDEIYRFWGRALNGTTMQNATVIGSLVDGTYAGGANIPGALFFMTSDGTSASPVERMRITSSGNVGIGTQYPGAKLHIQDDVNDAQAVVATYNSSSASTQSLLFLDRGRGSSASPASVVSGDSIYAIYGRGINGGSLHNTTLIGSFADAPVTGSAVPGAIFFATSDGNNQPAERMRITSAGRVGIGTSSPATALDLGGGCMTGTTCSDRNLKTDIRPLTPDGSALAKVMRLQGATFRWKADPKGKRAVGLIAQEVERVAPEVVSTSPADGQKGLSCTGVEALLIEALKDQERRIESQQRHIDALERALMDRR